MLIQIDTTGRNIVIWTLKSASYLDFSEFDNLKDHLYILEEYTSSSKHEMLLPFLAEAK